VKRATPNRVVLVLVGVSALKVLPLDRYATISSCRCGIHSDEVFIYCSRCYCCSVPRLVLFLGNASKDLRNVGNTSCIYTVPSHGNGFHIFIYDFIPF